MSSICAPSSSTRRFRMESWIQRFFKNAADALLPALFQNQPSPAPGVRGDTQGDACARLRQQFKKEGTELLKISPAVEKAWIESILVLETAAVVVAGKSFHPVLIVIGTLAEHFLAQDWNS